jgi:hypothetical protein
MLNAAQTYQTEAKIVDLNDSTFERKKSAGRPKNTTKTVKEGNAFIDYTKWQNVETGEIIEAATTVRDVYSDHNFFKIFLSDFARALAGFGGKKMKLLFHILDSIHPSTNMFIGTYEDITRDTGASRNTISSVIKFLKDIDFVRQRAPGVYMVSPKFLVKGSHGKRQALLIKYNHLNHTEAEAKEKAKQGELFK